MKGQLKAPRMRVVLYEGKGSRPLDHERRLDTLVTLLEDGHSITRSATDGAVALAAVRRKRARYPPDQVPGAKLVAFSVEAGGRWDCGSLNFLRRAAGRASERHPGLAALKGQGAAAVLASWLGQLSCALQKANVACLRSAGAGGRCPAPAPRPAGAGAGEEEPAGEDDWLNEAVEELLRHAAACAAAELP